MGYHILDEFIAWYCNTREGHGSNYLRNNFGNNKENFRNALLEYQDIFKVAFQYDLFAIDLNSKQLKHEIEKRTDDLYDGKSSFAQYSANKSNHMPRALLGEKNLIAFLEEKLTTQVYETSRATKSSDPTKFYQKREFRFWLLENFLTANSSDAYISYMNMLFSGLQKVNFQPVADWKRWVEEGSSTKIQDYADHLVCFLNDEMTNQTMGYPEKKLKNLKSAFHKYIDLLLELSAENNINDENEAENCIEDGLDKNLNKDLLFTLDDIKDNYFKRLTTQDRSTCQSVYFPISVLKKLFYTAPEDKKFFIDWIEEHIKQIKLYISEDGQETILSKINKIIIQKNQIVNVYFKDGSKKELYTPIAGETIYQKMKVSSFRDIHIDHIRPISDILNQNASQLPALKKITDAMNKINNGTLSGRNDIRRVGKILLEQDLLNRTAIEPLKADLQLIGNLTKLQLMNGNENQKKKAKV